MSVFLAVTAWLLQELSRSLCMPGDERYETGEWCAQFQPLRSFDGHIRVFVLRKQDKPKALIPHTRVQTFGKLTKLRHAIAHGLDHNKD